MNKSKTKIFSLYHQTWPFIILIMLFFVALSVRASDDQLRDPREYFFNQSFGDLNEELQAAKSEGKKGILLFFESEYCKYCQVMLKNVLSRTHVQDWYQNHFLSIAIDIRGDVEIKDLDGITLPSKVFAEHREVFMTPVLSFIDLEGAEVYRHFGMVKTSEELLMLGEYIVGGHYFDTEFKSFAQQQGLSNTEKQLLTPQAENVN